MSKSRIIKKSHFCWIKYDVFGKCICSFGNWISSLVRRLALFIFGWCVFGFNLRVFIAFLQKSWQNKSQRKFRYIWNAVYCYFNTMFVFDVHIYTLQIILAGFFLASCCHNLSSAVFLHWETSSESDHSAIPNEKPTWRNSFGESAQLYRDNRSSVYVSTVLLDGGIQFQFDRNIFYDSLGVRIFLDLTGHQCLNNTGASRNIGCFISDVLPMYCHEPSVHAV